jgi:hypothetical protein
MRIDECGVSSDDPARFEFADALEHGGRRQTDRPGDVRLGDPRVILKKIQDYAICFVDHSEIMS